VSVLVEGTCIIVSLSRLNDEYPGYAWAYLAEAAAMKGIRYATADAHLACVSVDNREAGNHWLRHLISVLGQDAFDAMRFVPHYAGKDQLGCVDFLDTVVLADGTTMCWMNGTSPGKVAGPRREQTELRLAR
jgi:hypothetical protein